MGLCASHSSEFIEKFYDYDELAVLGEGTSSIVFRGKCRQTGTPVAIKRITKSSHQLHQTNGCIRGAWEDQVSLLRQCGSHPNIVELLRVFETPTHVFLVLEFASGGELFETLISEGAYSEWDAKRFTKDIFQALRFLHERSIVHRDIKPENLLLTSKDTTVAHIKIADFGRATTIDESRGLPPNHHLTWAYCAPEALRSLVTNDYSKKINGKCDIWSVGTVVYVLLSGKHPFDPDGRHTKDQIMENIYQGNFSMTDPVWDPISKEAKKFIRKLLAVDPEERLSAKDALEDPWFDSQNTPREPLSVSISDGLGQYQRLMRKKFRTSVIVAMVAETFLRSLKRSNSKGEGQQDSQVSDTCEAPVATDAAHQDTTTSNIAPNNTSQPHMVKQSSVLNHAIQEHETQVIDSDITVELAQHDPATTSVTKG